MRFTSLLILGLLLIAGPASAQITLEEAQAEAEAWVVARWDAIKDRVKECLNEPGGPEKCHTAWAATTTENTDPADSALATCTLDDPGTFANTDCGSCYTGLQTFALAGITVPATAPLNATINIAKSTTGRGEQLIVEIQYDGVLWQRGWGDAILPGFDWVEVVP